MNSSDNDSDIFYDALDNASLLSQNLTCEKKKEQGNLESEFGPTFQIINASTSALGSDEDASHQIVQAKNIESNKKEKGTLLMAGLGSGHYHALSLSQVSVQSFNSPVTAEKEETNTNINENNRRSIVLPKGEDPIALQLKQRNLFLKTGDVDSLDDSASIISSAYSHTSSLSASAVPPATIENISLRSPTGTSSQSTSKRKSFIFSRKNASDDSYSLPFSASSSDAGWSPLDPLPGQLVRVKVKHKSRTEFAGLVLIQTFKQNSASLPVWSLKFSADGKYLAAAGGGKDIKVWAILPESLQESQLAIYDKAPLQVFSGHTSHILDLAWSKNNFLLSASMDKTVCLWHVSKEQRLCVFEHKDFIPSIAFHPKDDRFFLSGSLDGRLRLWSIPEKRLISWADLPTEDDAITAVGFTQSGNIALAGSTQGNLFFYETKDLKYITQIKVRSTKGKNAKGSKITGIDTLPGKTSAGDDKILISSNDSRLRLYSLRDKSLFCKYLGHKNTSSQIKATFSDDGEYIISGSEDNRVYIFSTDGRYHSAPKHIISSTLNRRDRIDSYESVEAHSTIVTATAIAPSHLKNYLISTERRIPTVSESFADGAIIATADSIGNVRIFENRLSDTVVSLPFAPSSEIKPVMKSGTSSFHSASNSANSKGPPPLPPRPVNPSCPQCKSTAVTSLTAPKSPPISSTAGDMYLCLKCEKVFQ